MIFSPLCFAAKNIAWMIHFLLKSENADVRFMQLQQKL